MDIVVTPSPGNPQHGDVRYGALTFPCLLGRGGVRADKREGDGATPVGRFALRRVVFRADKLEKPLTHLPAAEIARDDGWCDAPGDPAYNRPVKLPYPASAEHLWREDRMYDVVVILGHNDDPPVAGAGSAIFMHVTSQDGAPTAGCIALDRGDLLSLLGAVGPETFVDIRC